ncbi:unannotated protein [freshwater metagenome]|uniref:Unannotated protein n=1 Tax=freshwater metagenome TaxID=449393 RepID=A0A6J6FW58_9ZZZZ
MRTFVKEWAAPQRAGSANRCLAYELPVQTHIDGRIQCLGKSVSVDCGNLPLWGTSTFNNGFVRIEACDDRNLTVGCLWCHARVLILVIGRHPTTINNHNLARDEFKRN